MDYLLSPIRLNELEVLIQNSVEKALKEQLNLSVPQSDLWFNLNELCHYLPDKPTPATVYGWVHTASIPCHKGGKKLRFLKSEIDNWLMQGRKKTLTETEKEAENYLSKKHKK